MTLAAVHDFIAQQKLAVLSTTNAANSSQSALIGIAVTPELEIVFDTLKSSRKYPNLTLHPPCSCVIGWTGEQTVQYEGDARELSGIELARCQKIYFDSMAGVPCAPKLAGDRLLHCDPEVAAL